MNILYEDEDVVAILKPSGVMTHPDGVSQEETASDWFAKTYPNSKGVGETQKLKGGTEILRPGVVHRLDRETSGVLVFAKTQEVHAFLKEAFQNRLVTKVYLAFIYGVPKEREGVITFPIGRSQKDFRLRSAQPKARGLLREAITEYSVLADTGTHALIEARPKTGRTHQIRVHLKAIHHPIVCDGLYAPNRPCDLGLTRLGLHARSLTIPRPKGWEITITAPLPEDFLQAATVFGYSEESL